MARTVPYLFSSRLLPMSACRKSSIGLGKESNFAEVLNARRFTDAILE